MEVSWVPLLASLLLLRPAAIAREERREEIRAVGGSVTFRIADTATEENTALWSFGSDPIVTVQFGDPPLFVFLQKNFKPRFVVSENGRALSISQLRVEDAGTYSVTIGGKKSSFTLLVYRKLSEPTVTCEAQNCSAGSCSFSLRCSAPGAGLGNVSYSWRVRGQPEERESVVLLLNGSSRAEPQVLTCTARNAVSSSSVTVSAAGGLCTENSTHPLGPGALSGSWVGIGIGAGVGAAVLLLVFLGFFCKSKGWRKFRLSKSEPRDTGPTAECTTVYAEVGQSQQRIPKGIKAKPRAGESPTTIYSLVKQPEQAAENATATCLELV